MLYLNFYVSWALSSWYQLPTQIVVGGLLIFCLLSLYIECEQRVRQASGRRASAEKQIQEVLREIGSD